MSAILRRGKSKEHGEERLTSAKSILGDYRQVRLVQPQLCRSLDCASECGRKALIYVSMLAAAN